MQQIVMIRHLPTPWNIRGDLQGSQDIAIAAIDDKVRAKVEANKTQLKNKYGHFEHVFVSGLMRTQQTAEVYGITTAIVDPLLNELNFGEFEGRKKTDIIEKYQDKWFDDPEAIVLGEPLVALKERVCQFFNKYQAWDKLLIFGHGNWIRSAMSLMECHSLARLNHIHLDNNQIIELTWQLGKLK